MKQLIKQRRGAVNHTLVGYRFTGEALLNFWGSGRGTITMDATYKTVDEIEAGIVVSDIVNDGQFGCESIQEATVIVHEVWEISRTWNNEVVEDDRCFLYNNKLKVFADEIINSKRGI